MHFVHKFVKLIKHFFFAVTNCKHQWVPKDIAEAAEKYAKVSCAILGAQETDCKSTGANGPVSNAYPFISLKKTKNRQCELLVWRLPGFYLGY